jgi:hypothetical protein
MVITPGVLNGTHIFRLVESSGQPLTIVPLEDMCYIEISARGAIGRIAKVCFVCLYLQEGFVMSRKELVMFANMA